MGPPRWMGGVLAVLAGCASTGALASPAPRPADAQPASTARADQGAGPRFWYDPRLPLGRPPAESLLNVNGSPRITDPALYDRFWRDLAPSLTEWSADPRVRINPNFAAALMAKESGFDPRATSSVPANGIAQMTHVADLDLRIISREAPAFRWMHDEVERWPRAAAVHDSAARESRTDSLLARGALGPRTEYLFDAKPALRSSLFWLRILGTIWTEDEWPGQHGALARSKLGNGGALSERDLLALVTVSYNQGHPYVADLVERHGRDWTRHLNAESADYLERITRYTEIFQRAARGR
jgi:hypothetical protein